MNDPFQQLALRLAEQADVTEANRRYHTLVEFATLSFLVDAKIATIDQIVERIGVIQKSLPEAYQADDVNKRLMLVTSWLEQHKTRSTPSWTPEVIQGGLDQSNTNDPTPAK